MEDASIGCEICFSQWSTRGCICQETIMFWDQQEIWEYVKGERGTIWTEIGFGSMERNNWELSNQARIQQVHIRTCSVC